MVLYIRLCVKIRNLYIKDSSLFRNRLIAILIISVTRVELILVSDLGGKRDKSH